ncbi:MAG: choice-of-anchor J domain-containing protein [Bacteroidales bacterium]|nr:choice-of-anchor J domain-containing protein [Bacteroidales bacterium]
MKKFYLFFCLMVSALFAMSQKVTVSFTAATVDGAYCQLNEVVVSNLSRGWSDTLLYPDTAIVLTRLAVGEFPSAQQGIRVYPNPSMDYANVEFNVSEAGKVGIQVISMEGRQRASWEGYLQSGVHQARVSLMNPQAAFVVVSTENERYVGKVLQIGNGSGNTIELSGIPTIAAEQTERTRGNRADRLDAVGEYELGDTLSYVGMLMHDGEMLFSETVTQAQNEDETVTLVFDIPMPTPPIPGVEIQTLPYIQSFTEEFGTYMTYDVAGPQNWMIDYQTAKMTGYQDQVYYANEDWLISAPVDLTGVDEAKMTLSYIGRYFSEINNELTLWVSTDYNFGEDPTASRWVQLPATLIESNNWSDFVTTEVSLSAFVGQVVTVAVRYTSTDQAAGTIEIQSIAIEEGSPVVPVPGTEIQTLPYIQSFTDEFGTYTTYDAAGAQSWMIDYQTAKMTGYQNSTYYANEDWLISSPVAITGVNDAKLTMVYIARYFDVVSESITIWASTDYSVGNDPSTGRWTQVPATIVESNNWNTFQTAEIALTDYVGQTVIFAVKYTSTDQKAGTIEIQSIAIEEGNPVGPNPGPTPSPTGGSGTQEDPYNVAAGIELQGDQVTAWVHGYIVGSVKSGNSTVSANDQINWAAPFDLVTNVVIADDPACHEISQCLIVNLPAGKPLRAQVNLVDNPENFGKDLAVLGTLRTYFGQAGLRDSNGTEDDFVLDGNTPTPTPVPVVAIFSETFANGQGDFFIADAYLPNGLDYVWTHASQYKCMKASAFKNSTSYDAESWLVSPVIDLSGVEAATLSFEQAVNYASPTGALSVMISTDYTDDLTTATWTELNLSAWPAGSDWTFITSTADLTPYVGQTVTIVFKYTSTTSASCTWEIKNLVID